MKGFGMRARGWRQAIVAIGAVALALMTAGSAGAADGEPVTLRAALSEDPGVLDPHAYTGNFMLLDMIYEPLVNYGEDGTLEPGLAESWEVSDDGLTVTLYLREGVTFHDGTPFDAEAAKWNLDRWVGVEDHSWFQTSQVISAVNVVDPATIELVLSTPFPPLLQELSMARPVRFLSPASVGADGKFAEPVGAGPWMLESISETGAVLVPYDGYWGEQSSIERVEFKVIPDSQTRVSALRAGEVDLIGGQSMAPILPIEARDLEAADGVELLVGDPDDTVMLAFNPDGPLGEEAVRVAVTHALDREALTSVLYPEFGEPADTMFPPSVPDAGTPITVDFDPDASTASRPSSAAPAAGPDAARAALDGAGWVVSGDGRAKDGQPLELDMLVSPSPTHGPAGPQTAAEAIASELEQVGIRVTIKDVDSAAYYDEQQAGNWDLSFLETFGAPYDPAATATAFLTTGAGGVPLWVSPELDGLVEAAVFATDEGERAADYQKVFDYLGAQAAFVPIAHPPRFWAVGPAVSGFEVPVTEYDMDLTAVTVTR